MSSRRTALRGYYVTGILAVAVAVFYFVAQSWGEQLLIVSSDLLFILVSGGCSLLGLLAVRRVGLTGKYGLVYLGLFLAVFLWFLGETVWGIYEVVLHVDVPYPSVADVFYLGGYLPAFLGMGQFLWFFRDSFTPRRIVQALLWFLIIMGFSGIILLYPLMTESADALTKVFDVMYPLLDAFLITFAVTIFLTFGKGTFAKNWLWIALGMLLSGLGDIAFSYGTLMGWYYSGHPIEIIYLWSYLSLGLGFVGQTWSLGSGG